MADEKKQQVMESGDNLIDVLDDFNTPTGSQEAQSENVETAKETPEQVEDRQDAVNYLIDNKFADDPKGREQLAKAYRELQSKSDQEKAEFNKERQRNEKLGALDNYLKENPSVVKLIQEKVAQSKEELDGPPIKPENYDILDESIEGSEAQKWRMGYDKWLVEQGRKAATEEVNKLKNAMAQQEVVKKDTQELRDLGLSDDDISTFRGFINDPGNLNNANLVKIWKLLSGKGEEPLQNAKKTATQNQQVSAAAISGYSNPVKTRQSQELDQFWDGIMDTSQRR